MRRPAFAVLVLISSCLPACGSDGSGGGAAGSGGSAGSGGVGGSGGSGGASGASGGGGGGSGGGGGAVVGYVDPSSNQGPNSGRNPSLALDAENAKLLIATRNESNGNRPSLFRCNLDGSSCTHVDISAGRPAESGYTPVALVDASAHKLLVVTNDAANGSRLSLFRCNLDGSACSHTDLSAGQGEKSGSGPRTLIDEASGKLLVLTHNGANEDKPSLFRCNLDGTACEHKDLSAGQGTFSGLSGSLAIDSGAGKLLAVTGGGNHKPGLFRSGLDGSSPVFSDLSAGEGASTAYGVTVALVDAAAQKLLVVTRNLASGDRPSLFRSALDGSGSVHVNLTDVGAGLTAGPDGLTALVDPVHQKLLVITAALSNGGKPSLFRCALDGSGCEFSDLSGGQSGPSGANPSALLSPQGNLIVASENRANQGKLGLFFFPL